MEDHYVNECSHQFQEHLKNVISKQRENKSIDNSLVDERELILYRNKEKGKESAVASSAVKKHLQNFVIGRQKSKVLDATYGNAPVIDSQVHSSSKGYLNERDVIGSSMSLSKKYNFPLRKTASEPNLKVRSRLRQMLSADQRNSPLMPRRNRHVKRTLNTECSTLSNSNDNESNGSNPNSPPPPLRMDSRHPLSLQRTESGKLPINGLQELPESSSQSDLYTSPSLPNLPLKVQRRSYVNRDVLPETLLTPNLNYVDMKANSFHSDSIQAPGPIRNKNLQNRSHSKLNRTHSAPTTATSQLQQRILHKRMNMLRSKGLAESKAYSAFKDSILPSHPSTSTNIVVRPSYFGPMHLPWANFPMNPTFPYAPILLGHINPNFHAQNLERAGLLSLGSAATAQSAAVSESKDDQLPRSSSKSDLKSSEKETVEDMNVNDVEKVEELYENQVKNKHLDINHKPLGRTQSSPARAFLPQTHCRKYRQTTGVAYSHVMLQHGCSCGDDTIHIESSKRLKVIWAYLKERNLVTDDVDEQKQTKLAKCEIITPRKATTDELQLVHTQSHTLRYGTTSLARKEFNMASKFIVLPCGGIGVDNGIDLDTVWNEQETVNAARMAVGCTIDLSIEVAVGNLNNGFSIVRPPGHHAEVDLAMAFCYFNNVAIAAKKLLKNKLAKKILIIDWDAHHCNGTQKIFYDSPDVLVISVHRYDNGKFFPGTGSKEEVGIDYGSGFNVNVALNGGSNEPMSDPEYLAAFRSVVMPIALQFNPDFVFVSCGFAAAQGHPSSLSGYSLTPQCFGYLTYMVSQLANGKIVMVLEGGFEEKSLCECTEACIETLLGNKSFSSISNFALNTQPLSSAIQSINEVIECQSRYWKHLDKRLGAMSHVQYLRASNEKETCEAMAQLSVRPEKNVSLTQFGNENTLKYNNSNDKICISSDDGEHNTDIEIE